MIRLTIAALLASVSLSGVASGASSIDSFVGRWTGDAIETSGQPISSDMFTIEVAEQDGGFELSWSDLEQSGQGSSSKKLVKARFVSTSRENVFEYEPETGSFLDRMFAPPETGNPLEGETLLWARIEADMLSVYSLTIDDNGGFDLDHYRWTKTEAGLDLRYRGQTESLGEEIVIEGQLVPAGD